MALSQVAGRLIGVRRHEVDPGGGGARRVPRPVTAVVVGGGIAGMSAAVVLAERGCRGDRAGGRGHPRRPARRLAGAAGPTAPARSTSTASTRSSGSTTTGATSCAEPTRPCGFLRPVPGYPVLSAEWPTEEFGRLPPAPPANLLTLLARSPSLRLRDLRAMDRDAALPLLTYDPVRTYAEFDDTHRRRAARLAAAARPGPGDALRGLLALVLQPRGARCRPPKWSPSSTSTCSATRKGWPSTAPTRTTPRRSGGR